MVRRIVAVRMTASRSFVFIIMAVAMHFGICRRYFLAFNMKCCKGRVVVRGGNRARRNAD